LSSSSSLHSSVSQPSLSKPSSSSLRKAGSFPGRGAAQAECSSAASRSSAAPRTIGAQRRARLAERRVSSHACGGGRPPTTTNHTKPTAVWRPHDLYGLACASAARSDDPPYRGRWPPTHPGGQRWAEGPEIKAGRSAGTRSGRVQARPPARGRRPRRRARAAPSPLAAGSSAGVAGSSAGGAACLRWEGGPRPPGRRCPTSRGLAPAPPASPQALPPRPAAATARPGRAWCFSSVYQCGEPCLVRPEPRGAPPTSSIGPAGHRKRPPRLGRCAGAHHHQPNRLSAAAAARAQRAGGAQVQAWPARADPSGGPTAPLARLRRAAAAVGEGRLFFSEGPRSGFRTLARRACGSCDERGNHQQASAGDSSSPSS